MSKFIYRMQNILNIKYKLEEQAKTEFMLANKRLQDEESRLEELINRRLSYEKKGRELLEGTLDVVLVNENSRAIESIKQFIISQKERVEEAKRQVEIKGKILSKLMQERKAQEKLKEKAFEAFVKEENSKESKEIDELVSFTYGKRRREEYLFGRK